MIKQSGINDRKVVLITGASSGIGKVCAEHLATRGYRVFGTQRAPVESVESINGVELISLDVTEDESVRGAVESVRQRSGRIDAVVNNAGYALMGSVEETSLEEARAQMETNFFGVLRVCGAVLPLMRSQGSGYIINISSLAGVLGLPFSGLYSASKFAVEGMTESLRLETKRHGIRVVLIEPGDFRTQLPANRRIAEGQGPKSPYLDLFKRVSAAQEKDEANAPTPEPIAMLVDKILRSTAPRLRYTTGMTGQRIVVPMKRLLPQRTFEWVLSIALGL
ncbi:MAG TPA: SDR family oxidoreductase [Blastocatellia bacterium]|nr:SDR family oxidoreductase [Blastocatellia bacterium]